MKYKCENELNTLSFRDFLVQEINIKDGVFSLMTDGGVAKYDNSCNEMLEERFISETLIRIMDAEIVKFILEGSKYYNADDVLISEEPDKEIPESEYKTIFKKLTEGKIFFIGEKSTERADKMHEYEICIDIEGEIVIDTYWITVKGSRIITEFDRFMNKVMQ